MKGIHSPFFVKLNFSIIYNTYMIETIWVDGDSTKIISYADLEYGNNFLGAKVGKSIPCWYYIGKWGRIMIPINNIKFTENECN